jgi:NTP pyrophosphatase (non-canonical NTP hydrolase)
MTTNELKLLLALQATRESANGLLKRFNAPLQADAQARKLSEEVNEVIKAYEQGDFSQAKLEFGDVLVCVFNLLYALRMSDDELTAVLDEVNRKNDAKTLETHYLNTETGTIERIGRVK